MCKIDLPRKNMVIERERAQKRRGERLLGISTHTHTLAQSHVCRAAQMHTLACWKEYRKKCWPGWNGKKKKTFSPAL